MRHRISLTRGRLSSLLCAALLVTVVAASSGPTTPVANAATTCKVSGKKLGPTYTTSLKVTKTSCSQGEKLVKAWYKCRTAHGKKNGRCTKKTLGYKCTERRSNAIPTQFDATVTCKKSSARIVHTYTQYT